MMPFIITQGRWVMKCPRCNNSNKNLFFEGSKGIYCRACISFKRILIEEELKSSEHDELNINVSINLDYKLTEFQENCAKEIISNIPNQNVLLEAVTGAGKTEIAMRFIEDSINKKLRVGFVIARRQVVLEIKERLASAFDCKVVAVCEGYTSDTEGDIVVCTAHQCYRYFEKKFDYLIVDEPDAFPLKGNDVLMGIVRNSCKGNILYMSATPDESLYENAHVIKLPLRPHNNDLIVPTLNLLPIGIDFIYLIKRIIENSKKEIGLLVFVPTIKQATIISIIANMFVSSTSFTSQSKDKELILDKFINKEYSCLICTTVLERGITFSGIDVFVYNAHHDVFDEASLVQIAGRVGRKKERLDGDCVFMGRKLSKSMKSCIDRIKISNYEKMCLLSK